MEKNINYLTIDLLDHLNVLLRTEENWNNDEKARTTDNALILFLLNDQDIVEKYIEKNCPQYEISKEKIDKSKAFTLPWNDVIIFNYKENRWEIKE